MLIPHDTFSLWLILSVGIHVATLALWPLPPSWKVGQPSYVVVDFRPAGGPAGTTAPNPSEQLGSPPNLFSQATAPQQAVKKAITAPAKPKKVIKKQSKSLVIPEPKVLPTEVSTSSAIPQENVKDFPEATLPASASTNDIEETVDGAQQDEASSYGKDQARGLPGGGGSGNGYNQILGSGTSGSGKGHGMSRATPLGYGDNPAMPYPRSARRRGWEGEVLLKVNVSAHGRVLSVGIEKSSGYGILDDTALQAVSEWRFRPARVNGLSRPDTVIVPIHFRLDAP